MRLDKGRFKYYKKSTGDIVRVPKKISYKHVQFCEEYLSNGQDGSKAAVTLGYSKSSAPTTAKRMLNNQLVRDYLNVRTKKIEKVTQASLDWKIGKLCDIVKNTDLGTVTVRDGLAAIQELNKMQGHYAPEQHVNISGSIDDVQAALMNAKKQLIQKDKEHEY